MPLQTAPLDLRRTFGDIEIMFSIRRTEKVLKWMSDYDDRISRWTVGGYLGTLRQAPINLLANSFEFTDQGSVTLKVTLLQPDVFNLVVADSEPGIAEVSTPRIFAPFSQPTEGNEKCGASLGLTIFTHQIELTGGHLENDSQPDQRARFYFSMRLPAIVRPAHADTPWRLDECGPTNIHAP